MIEINHCTSLLDTHFKKVTQSGMISNKNVWQTIKPLVSNKNGISNSNIMLIEEDKLITDEKKTGGMF